jgi:hypothetical protein
VGSIPIARSLRSGNSLIAEIAAVAQLVEYVLGKDGVKGSSPFSSFSAFSRGIASCRRVRVGSLDLDVK